MKKKSYYRFPGQERFPFEGKVRVVSDLGDLMVAETTNDISAFDVVLPPQIPHKGAVLNMTTAYFMRATEDIIPNCLLDVPHQRFSIWKKTKPFKIEVIVRAYNTGSFYKNFTSKGLENPWGYKLPELKKNEQLPFLVVTPTTKESSGHDRDISSKEIVDSGLATEGQWSYIHDKAIDLFKRGEEMADHLGLILVDTKYEFGIKNGIIYLIDEIHTPDSSRYWYKDSYEEAFEKGEDPRALSKEFLRQWLIDQGFNGNKDDVMPFFSEEFIKEISDRYLELCDKMGISLEDVLNEEEDEEIIHDNVCKSLQLIRESVVSY